MSARAAALAAGLAASLLAARAPGYPLDAFERTRIARLPAYDRAREALLARGSLVPGALWPSFAVRPRLDGRDELGVPAPDPELTAHLRAALGADAGRTAVSLLDLSEPARPRYAEHQGSLPQLPGSVGKIVVALAWFQALADAQPGDVFARERLLRETTVVASPVVVGDDHLVPFYGAGDQRLARRPIEPGDRANLWTWLDWMTSASSNAAASEVMRQLVLLRAFGPDYPPEPARAAAFFRETPKARIAALLREAVRGALVRNGLDPQRLYHGSLFTRAGRAAVPGAGSVATTRELIRYLLRLEEGRLVDGWSSRELKRLLYLTERRIRYASQPALDDAAVAFKSGSLYSCRPEPRFECRKYQGNVRNFMNSVAVVEEERGDGTRLHYLVAVLSNVLRRDSAEAHRALAATLHALVAEHHPPGD